MTDQIAPQLSPKPASSAPEPSRLRTIQVGLGFWGRDWATNVLPNVDGVHIVARVDGDPEARRAADETVPAPDASWHTTLSDALRETDAEAVLATVAIPAHAEVALAALQAGKHVLIEKPFAVTLDEARAVVAEAEQRSLVASIAQNYRFLPVVDKVIESARSRRLGPVDRGRIDFRKYHPTDYRRSTSPLDHSYLSQIAIHHFDLLRAIIDQEPTRISCRAWNAPWVQGLGTVAAAALIELASGGVIAYSGSLRSTGPETSWSGDWHLECERGELSWRAGPDGSEIVQELPREGAARRMTLPQAPYAEERARLLAQFVDAVRTGAEPPSPARDNLRSLAMMTAAIESSETGQPVDIAMS